MASDEPPFDAALKIFARMIADKHLRTLEKHGKFQPSKAPPTFLEETNPLQPEETPEDHE